MIVFGALMYAVGIYGMNIAESGFILQLMAGVVTGIGVAFTAFSLAMASMVRVVGIEKRSLVLGLGTAAGSFGQVLFSPLTQGLISTWGWSSALLFLAATTLILVPLAIVLPNNPGLSKDPVADQTLTDALGEAFSHRGFVLLTIGFFRMRLSRGVYHRTFSGLCERYRSGSECWCLFHCFGWTIEYCGLAFVWCIWSKA